MLNEKKKHSYIFYFYWMNSEWNFSLINKNTFAKLIPSNERRK